MFKVSKRDVNKVFSDECGFEINGNVLTQKMIKENARCAETNLLRHKKREADYISAGFLILQIFWYNRNC